MKATWHRARRLPAPHPLRQKLPRSHRPLRAPLPQAPHSKTKRRRTKVRAIPVWRNFYDEDREGDAMKTSVIADRAHIAMRDMLSVLSALGVEKRIGEAPSRLHVQSASVAAAKIAAGAPA